MAYEFRKMNLSGTDINVKDEEARAGISEAVTKATTALANADSALTSVTTQNVAIAAVQAAVGAQNTDIVNLKAKVGTGTLNTTARNLTAAVNEVRADVRAIAVRAENISGTTNEYGEFPTSYNVAETPIIAYRATVGTQLVHGGIAVTAGGACMICLANRTTGAALANTAFNAVLYILELVA